MKNLLIATMLTSTLGTCAVWSSHDTPYALLIKNEGSHDQGGMSDYNSLSLSQISDLGANTSSMHNMLASYLDKTNPCTTFDTSIFQTPSLEFAHLNFSVSSAFDAGILRTSPPDPFLLQSHLFLDKSKKMHPLQREGLILPKVDPASLGLSHFYKRLGIHMTGTSSFLYRPLVARNFFQWMKKEFSSYVFAPSLIFLDPLQDLAQKDIASLTKEEVICLFNALTSHFSSLPKNAVSLEAFLEEKHIRDILLEAAQKDPTLLIKPLEDDYLLKRTRTIFAHPDFLEHILHSQVFYDTKEDGTSICTALMKKASRMGNTKVIVTLIGNESSLHHMLHASHSDNDLSLLADLAQKAALCGQTKVLDSLFSQEEIVEHLEKITHEKGSPFLLSLLKGAVVFDKDKTVLCFYKNPAALRALHSCIINPEDQVFVNAGFLMAFNTRTAHDIRALIHPGTLSILMSDPGLCSFVFKKAVKERNALLITSLLDHQDVTIPDEALLKTFKFPHLWHGLTPQLRSALLALLQKTKPEITQTDITQQHNATILRERLHTMSPLLIENIEKISPHEAKAYAALLSQGAQPDLSLEDAVSVQRQKHALTQRLLHTLGPSAQDSTPWARSRVTYAHQNGLFGQGVRVLISEPGALGTTQKEGFLKTHLEQDTFFSKKKECAHNTGVTSIVTHMAPLARITSTSTSHQETLLGEETQNPGYTFINCSWGVRFSSDSDENDSIFGASKELTRLLGRSDTVLIKSAGNEGCDLTHPDPSSDSMGLVHACLFKRLSAAQYENLIIAINLDPTQRVAESSNIPGSHMDLFRNALSAQGDKTYWLDETGLDYRPVKGGGTSSAAPLITGAAALVQSYKPDFSPILVKKCLLHSATRDFLVSASKESPAHWVYETPSHTSHPIKNPFDFHIYGMGLLNVESALRYADILETHLQSLGEKGKDMTFEDYESLRETMHGVNHQSLPSTSNIPEETRI